MTQKWLLILVVLAASCTTTPQQEWIAGGLYSTKSEDGGFSIVKVLKVDDQGVEARPILHIENLCHGLGIEGISRQSVDRFARQSDELPGLQFLHGGLHHRAPIIKSCYFDPCVHAHP